MIPGKRTNAWSERKSNPPPPNPIATTSYITVKIYFSRATHRSEILYKISAREISGNIRISRTEYGTSIRNIFGFYDARTMRSILNNAIIARAKSIRDSRPLHSLFHRVHREIILLILFLCVFFFCFPEGLIEILILSDFRIRYTNEFCNQWENLILTFLLISVFLRIVKIIYIFCSFTIMEEVKFHIHQPILSLYHTGKEFMNILRIWIFQIFFFE